MNKILICGSVAYDTILNLSGKFNDTIKQNSLREINFNSVFDIDNITKQFGGCAANIAYSSNLLGLDIVPMATVGAVDYNKYANWFKKNNLNTKYIKQIDNTYTACAYILTDSDNNQITTFHSGAMNYSHINKIAKKDNFDLVLISPDGKDGMLEHTKQCVELGIPFIFDPGQAMPLFSKEQINYFISYAHYVIVNEYEATDLITKTGLSEIEIAKKVKVFIVTLGSKGSKVYTKDGKYFAPAVSAAKSIDPTGCGDCYRAGVLYGIINNFKWQKTIQLANLLGSIKVGVSGPQNHTFDLASVSKMYINYYKEDLGV